MDESLVIELYAKYDNCRQVAEELGTYSEEIRRVLIKNDISRTGNRPQKHPKTNKRLPSNCRSIYCSALVVMLRECLDLPTGEIRKATGIPTNIISNIFYRKRPDLKIKRYKRVTTKTIDEIEREYLDGASTYTLGDKYGVCHETISKWMKQRGHVRGKGYYNGSNKGHEKILKNAFRKCAERTFEESNGQIELVEWISREKGRYVCHVCGTEFFRYNDPNHKAQCPACTAVEISRRKEEREAKKELRRLERADEYAKEKHCAICGAVFHSEASNAKYCSKKCKTKNKTNKQLARDRRKTAERQAIELKKDKTCQCCGAVFHSVSLDKIYCDDCAVKSRRCNHRLRAKKYKVAYEPGITVKKLIERDDNICQICGYHCDSNDLRYGVVGPLYPTIDHIIAMVNGGGHVWSNVQLAHFACNCEIKRDLLEDELTEEVIAHAKEQAIAYICNSYKRDLDMNEVMEWVC